ncbi:MAG: hypothetical protein GYA14_04745 [Ignavibacteria bacterium]|nr:hypothetical protein [Ignavibacteria bacterium]
MNQTVTKKLFLIAFFFLLGIFSLTLFAQDKKDDLDKKLDQLKGKVEKLTVKVDGKDVVFEGKEAESLAKKLRTFGKMPNMVWLSDEDSEFEGKDGNVMMYRFNKLGKEFKVGAVGEENKKVEVKIDDGKKKVTVTTTKDGKEETKTYEGEEAEKFLKENEKVGKFNIMVNDEDGMGDRMIFFNKKLDDDNGCCCCKGRMSMKHLSPGKGKKIIIEKIEKDTKDSGKDKK